MEGALTHTVDVGSIPTVSMLLQRPCDGVLNSKMIFTYFWASGVY